MISRPVRSYASLEEEEPPRPGLQSLAEANKKYVGMAMRPSTFAMLKHDLHTLLGQYTHFGALSEGQADAVHALTEFMRQK